MARKEISVDHLMAVAAPRNPKAAVLMDMLLYERALAQGLVSANPTDLDAAGLKTILQRALIGQRSLKVVVPAAAALTVDIPALNHVLLVIGDYFKDSSQMTVQVAASRSIVKIGFKSLGYKPNVDAATLKRKLAKAITMTGSKLDIDPLAPGAVNLFVPVAPRSNTQDAA